MEKLDPDQIYDPNVLFVPKVKQLFRITKEHHSSLSCRSAHGGGSHSTYSSHGRASPLLGAAAGELTHDGGPSIGLDLLTQRMRMPPSHLNVLQQEATTNSLAVAEQNYEHNTRF